MATRTKRPGEDRLIKKYPNRRLYDTQTSTYVTLADIKGLVMSSENFKVVDAKTDEDLTRAMLLHHLKPKNYKIIQKLRVDFFFFFNS